MSDLTQMSKMALSYTVTTTHSGYCEDGKRKAVVEGINSSRTARASQCLLTKQEELTSAWGHSAVPGTEL